MSASRARAAGFRPERRRDAATWPNARAAGASKPIGSKSASACWTCAVRRARSASSSVTSGPTDSSASVIVEISGTSGSDGWIGDPRQQEQRARVEQALSVGHSRGSMTRSTSRRSRRGSTTGTCRQRSSSTAAERSLDRTGRSSATGRPSLVTVMRCPAATRSTTSPPRLRSSRMVTLSTASMYHA